jgi:hypothetical protein
VVAINWAERAILLGEGKWGASNVDRAVIRELLESNPPKVLKDLTKEDFGSAMKSYFPCRNLIGQAVRGERYDL